jgi:hypothetical protein
VNKETAWDQGDSLHSLVNDGISTRFTNDQISPLDNDNGDEECSVASVFQLLSVGVGLQTEIVFMKGLLRL